MFTKMKLVCWGCRPHHWNVWMVYIGCSPRQWQVWRDVLFGLSCWWSPASCEGGYSTNPTTYYPKFSGGYARVGRLTSHDMIYLQVVSLNMAEGFRGFYSWRFCSPKSATRKANLKRLEEVRLRWQRIKQAILTGKKGGPLNNPHPNKIPTSYLVGGWTTHLKKICSSNWVHLPQVVVKITNRFKTTSNI